MDWRDIESFFDQACRFIEVNLAVGSLVYRDDENLAFTFPGQRADKRPSFGEPDPANLRQEIEKELDQLAEKFFLETPPLCLLSSSNRSFVQMVSELKRARKALSVPLPRAWALPRPTNLSEQRHICPVCLVRLNEPPSEAATDNVRKSYPCKVCRERRRSRLDTWLKGARSEESTTWISEVADANDRVALLTFGVEIDLWLDGSHVDSLRAQSISEWRRHNPVLKERLSPGRIYRFWRTAENFFQELLVQFRAIASRHSNPWRTRRLLFTPDNDGSGSGWQDGETYSGQWQGAPFELLYLREQKGFVTICNLAGEAVPDLSRGDRIGMRAGKSL